MEKKIFKLEKPLEKPGPGSSKAELNKWREDVKKRKKRKKERKLVKFLEKDRLKKEKAAAAANGEIDQASSALDQHHGRDWTLSLALPGSILDNAQSPELRTYLAGQIARALAIFNVDEVIIFDETGTKARSKSTEGVFEGIGKKGNPSVQLARILQYLECPQYLRKEFFPRHNDLQYAGLLNPLDTPHHMRIDEEASYREGTVLNRPVKPGKGSFVNAGMRKEVQIDKMLQPGLRVTVKLDDTDSGGHHHKGVVVSPGTPRAEAGLYWGYTVRLAPCLSSVFTESPHPGGYDLTVGTSDGGSPVDHAVLPHTFKHMLVIFGGVSGLEASFEADEKLKVDDVSLLFDFYLNTCPNQGSRTIRTEEAILISLSVLRPKLPAFRQKK